jgi:pyrophosphatase PpaX
MKIDTLLLDLDGTLVDSNELILETFRRTLKKYVPARKFSPADLLVMMGPPLYETFGKMTEDETLVTRMIATYREIYPTIEFDYVTIYPGVLDTLQQFHALGYHIAIITTKFQESASPSLRHFGIGRYIDFVIGLDDITHPKPDPEPLNMAMDRFKSRNALMIGDNGSDILAGKNAGILTCGVGWSYKSAEIKALQPDFWIDRFADLIPLIQKYNEED